MKKNYFCSFSFHCFSVGWAQTVPPCTLEITDAETLLVIDSDRCQ